ncbi:hypothetical protein RSA42_01065 [Exiguobacterium indicum]|uniref:hypothetical protein n=1 Tax=Exiguobacterium indicum TaxID=296995 RepID=UPI00073611E2|nr:hypothetical protein [Exiguobacterium indicum]KTR62426.1 hypothetical protein RSA42_01065 [Exiguobacterium indicum]
MKRWIIGIASLIGVIGGSALLMTFAFTQDMDSDETKETEVQRKAKTYLEQHLPEARVTGSLYDNMGNFPFEYAARAIDDKTNTEFFVYQQEESGRFVDSYHASLWEDRLERRIPSPTLEQLNNQLSVTVLYDNDKIQQLGDARFDSKAYLRKEVAPTLLVDVPRKRHEQDKAQVTAWAKSLREQQILQHMTVKIDYVSGKGELLEDGNSLFVTL